MVDPEMELYSRITYSFKRWETEWRLRRSILAHCSFAPPFPHTCPHSLREHPCTRVSKLWRSETQSRVSQLGHYRPYVSVGGEAVLCIVRCLAEALAPTYQMPVASFLQLDNKTVSRYCQTSFGELNLPRLKTTDVKCVMFKPLALTN